MTIYKEMEYKMRLPKFEKLAEGQEGRYKWVVLSLGTHPCGYVSVPKNHPFYGKSYEDIQDKIRVHGGLSFSGKLHGSKDLWFGWDYAHCEDHTYLPVCGVGFLGKRWSTSEIVDECLKVTKQFQIYEKAEVQSNFKLTHQGKIPIDQYEERQGFIAKSSPNDNYRLLKIIGGQLYDYTTSNHVNHVAWFAYEPINIVVEIKKESK